MVKACTLTASVTVVGSPTGTKPTSMSGPNPGTTMEASVSHQDTDEQFRWPQEKRVAHQVLLCRSLKSGRAEMRSGAKFMLDTRPRSLVEAVEKAINEVARRSLRRNKAK
jgi:hypothetical protein